MKVLWFSNSPCGSLRRNKNSKVMRGGWLISLESELKKKADLELEVAYFSRVNEQPFYFEGVKYYPIYKKDNIFRLIFSRYYNLKKEDEKYYSKLVSIVKESNPDIIHIHGTEERFGIICNVIKKVPIVFSIQGLIGPIKEKYFSGIPKNIAYRFDSLNERLRGEDIKTYYKSFCYRAEREIQFLKNAKYIFGRTLWDKCCTLSINPQRKYYTVNEILQQPYYEKKWKGSFNSETINIISIVSGGIYKGMETLLKSAHLLKQYSNIKFEWHVIGYTDKNKWVYITEKMTGIKAKNNNIIFHGRLEAEKISDLLIKSDIYVHVSHIENSPNSVCEAMLVGMPVIASFAGGTCSILEHEKEGILYQDGDPYILSGSIINLIHHPDIAKEYANNAYKRASSRHDKNRIVEEVIDGYKNIIFDFKTK